MIGPLGAWLPGSWLMPLADTTWPLREALPPPPDAPLQAMPGYGERGREDMAAGGKSHVLGTSSHKCTPAARALADLEHLRAAAICSTDPRWAAQMIDAVELEEIRRLGT